MFFAKSVAKANSCLDSGHCFLEDFVAYLGVIAGIGAEVDRIGHFRSAQVEVDCLADEWNEGSGNFS